MFFPPRRHLVVMFVALATAGCASRQGPANHAQQSQRPAASPDEWETESPAAANLDPEMIAAMPARVRDGSYQNVHGILLVSGGLSLRPRDMAKIGTLVLNGGRWHGKQIVSEAWVRESIRQQAPDLPYGYQWWLLGEPPRVSEAYGALGRGGQFIIVLPELEMVAVFTGWNDGPVFGSPPFDMLKRYILPAAAKMSGR